MASSHIGSLSEGGLEPLHRPSARVLRSGLLPLRHQRGPPLPSKQTLRGVPVLLEALFFSRAGVALFGIQDSQDCWNSLFLEDRLNIFILPAGIKPAVPTSFKRQAQKPCPNSLSVTVNPKPQHLDPVDSTVPSTPVHEAGPLRWMAQILRHPASCHI